MNADECEIRQEAEKKPDKNPRISRNAEYASKKENTCPITDNNHRTINQKPQRNGAFFIFYFGRELRPVCRRQRIAQSCDWAARSNDRANPNCGDARIRTWIPGFGDQSLAIGRHPLRRITSSPLCGQCASCTTCNIS
jgi:hypothetical protein